MFSVVVSDLEDVPSVQIYEQFSKTTPSNGATVASCTGTTCTVLISITYSAEMSPGANHYFLKATDPYYSRYLFFTVINQVSLSS